MAIGDLAIIGGGPGGYTAAILAAQEGLKVLLIEQDRLGGTCLNRGCLPTKCFLAEAKALEQAKRNTAIVGAEGLKLDPAQMLRRKNRVVDFQVRGLAKIMESYGIEVVSGQAELVGPGVIRVKGQGGRTEEIRARRIILATGSQASVPPFIKIDGQTIITTDQALELKTVPETLAIIGGGVIGLELATIYQALGARVVILEMLPDIIMAEDEEIRQALRESLEARGIEIHCRAEVKAVEVGGRGAKVSFVDQAGQARQVQAGQVLAATGRKPNLEGIDPDRLGLAMNGPFVKVDHQMQTNLEGVWAIGDLVGGFMLAQAATAEAEAAVMGLVGQDRTYRPELIPRHVFTIPEIASVGLTESQAIATGRPVRVGRFPYNYSGKAQALGEINGLVKIIGDAKAGEILGAHLLGEGASDLIGEILLAMNLEAAVDDLGQVVKGHPTLSECLREAALAWEGRAVNLPRAQPDKI